MLRSASSLYLKAVNLIPVVIFAALVIVNIVTRTIYAVTIALLIVSCISLYIFIKTKNMLIDNDGFLHIDNFKINPGDVNSIKVKASRGTTIKVKMKDGRIFYSTFSVAKEEIKYLLRNYEQE